MASNKKFKLAGSNTNDDDLDFGLDDFESSIGRDVQDSKHQDTSKIRTPVDFTKGFSSSTFKSAAKSVFPSITTKIGQHMPNSVKLLGEANQTISDIAYMKSQFVKDIQPSINELKRAGQTLGPKIKPFLPKFAQKWYDKATTVDTSANNANIGKEDGRALQISGALSSVFDKQLDAQKEIAAKDLADRKEESLINRQLEQNRHSQSFAELTRVRVATEFDVNYRKNIQLPYYKQMLELKYKHLFTSMDTQTTLATIAKTIDSQLDAIRHNTGLPDYQKINKIELVKEEMAGRTTSAVANYVRDVMGRVKDRVLDPFKSALSDVASGTSAVSDMSSMDMEGDGALLGMKAASGVTKAGEFGGGFAGNFLGSKFGKSIAKVLFGDAGKSGLIGRKTRNFDDLLSNAKVKSMLKLDEWADNSQGGILGTILDLVRPNFERGSGSIKNAINKDPDKAATWTNQSHITLNQIIPGLLAKQLQQLEQLNTGKPAEELVYDTRSNDFIRSSAVQEKVLTEALGSKSQRSYQMGQDIGQIRGAYKTITGELDTTTFDSFEQDFAKFLTNSALYKQVVKPEFIRDFAQVLLNPTVGSVTEEKDEDDLDIDIEDDFKLNDISSWKEKLGITSQSIEEYINYTMKGMDRPGEFCILLANMFFSIDGTKNEHAINLINNIIISRFSDIDRTKAVLDKYIRTGNARHLKGVIGASTGSSFRLSDAAILAGQQDISKVDDFSRARDYGTDSSARAFKEILDTGEDNDKSFKERLLAEIRDSKLGRSEIGRKGLDWIDEKSKAKFDASPDAFLSKDDTFYNKYIPSYIDKLIKEKISPRMTQTLEKMKATNTNAGKAAFKVSEDRGFTETEGIYDPYQHHDDESTIIHPYASNRYTKGSGKNKGVVLSKNAILNTKITNLDELATKLSRAFKPSDTKSSNKSLADSLKELYTSTTPLPVTVISKEDKPAGPTDNVVNAVTQFENTFKKYAEEQKEFRKLIESIGTTVAGLGDTLNILVGNTTGMFTKLWRKLPGKSDITKKINQLWDGTKEKFKIDSLMKGGKYVKDKAWGVGKYTKDKVIGASKYTKDKALGLGGYLGSKALSAGGYLKDKSSGALSSLLALSLGGAGFAKDKLSSMGAGLRAALGRLTGKGETAKEKLNDFFSMKGIKQKITKLGNKLKYVNIYLKDEVVPDKPLLSIHDQEEGVYFDSGKKVQTSYDIDKPVYDKNNQVRISHPNLEHGIVDVNNHPLKGGGIGLLGFGGSILRGVGKLGKGALNTIGDILTGQNPLLKMYGSLLKFGGKMTGAIGGGILNGVRRFFGGGDLTKKDLQDLVTTRLDTIIELLKSGNGPTPNKPKEQPTGGFKLSDKDKDGDVDTAMEARAAQEEAKSEKEEKTARLSIPKFLKRIADKLDGKGEKKPSSWFDKLKDLLFKGLGIFTIPFWKSAKALLKGFGKFMLAPILGSVKLLGKGVMMLFKYLMSKKDTDFDTSPDDFLSGNDKDKKGRTTRRGGRSAGKRGMLGRAWDFSKRLGGGAINGAKALGGRALGTAGTLAFGAKDLYDTWTDDTLTDKEKNERYLSALGGMGGGAAGATLGAMGGSFLGPVGGFVGGLAGGAIGAIAGEEGVKWAAGKLLGDQSSSGDGSVVTLPDGVKVCRPTNSDIITSPFGPRNVKGGSPNHRGIDIRAKSGDPIFAVADGTVTISQPGWGMIEILHTALKVRARYMHLSQRLVQVGQHVTAGQQIGRAGGVGASGADGAYAAHLHFDVRQASIVNYTKGCPVYDPEQWFAKLGVKFTRKDGAPSSDASIDTSKDGRYIAPHLDANGKVVSGSMEQPANGSANKAEFPFNPNTGEADGVVAKGTSAADALKGGNLSAAFAGTEFGRNMAAAAGGAGGTLGGMLAGGGGAAGASGVGMGGGDSTPSEAGQQNTTIDASGLGSINVPNKEELARQFMDGKLTRGRRNNNPGNVTVSAWTKAQPGYIDGDRTKGKSGIAAPGKGDSGFGRFETPEQGIRAAVKLIKDTYGKQGLDTISKITYKYSPPHENDTAGLIRKYSQASGFKPDEKINWNNQEAVTRYIAAKIKAETGFTYPEDVLKRGVLAAYDGGANGTTTTNEGGIESTMPTPNAAGGEGAMPPAQSSGGSAPTVVDNAVTGSGTPSMPEQSAPSVPSSAPVTATPVSANVPAPTQSNSALSDSNSRMIQILESLGKNIEYLPMIYKLIEGAIGKINNTQSNTTNSPNYTSADNTKGIPSVSLAKPRRVPMTA